MSSAALSSLPIPLLESIVIGTIDQAFGNSLTLNLDNSGVSAGIPLGQPLSLQIVDASLSGGLSGRVYIQGLSAANWLSATLFDDFTVALTTFDLTFANGGLAASHIAGSLTIPFFTDSQGNPSTVDIDISTKADGALAITVSNDQSNSGNGTTADGLVQLKYDLGGGFSIELDVDSLEITETNGVWAILISGNLLIETPGLSWPSFELRGLGIDSKGHITLAAGWIDLPSQMSLDYFGFHVALQKLGIGTDGAGNKWIGFNGDISLVEGIPLGGSVRGMKITLSNPPSFSFTGVGVDFEIPDVLTFSGEIDHYHATSESDLANAGLNTYIWQYANGGSLDIFAGKVSLNIEALEGFEIDASFIVGTIGGQTLFFLDIAADLPFGIPIFADIALYGMEGLFAINLQPQPEPAHTWWEWFKWPTGGNSGGVPPVNTTASQPEYSATDFQKWMAPMPGAFALGAGVTIGTQADDGFTASAAITLILMLPGPVISLIGKANILSKRISSANEDATFEAMATYDGNSGTFDLTIDAQYSIPLVLDISGTAELYVDASLGEWFFALGMPPHEQRVQARVLDIFEANSYFVVSDTGLVMGSWIGYKNSWSFGPLSASIDAYIATLGAIQWSPLQVAAGLQLYGNLQLSAFGIGVGLTGDALIEGCAPNPWWVHGELSVELDLPWPLPNLGATISLTWGGDSGTLPPVPLSLSHVDASLADHCDRSGHPTSDHYLLLSHKKGGFTPDLTASWDASSAPGILAPSGAATTRNGTPDMLPDLNPASPPAGETVPILPQDAHFVLNFSHPTTDGTHFGFVGAATAPPDIEQPTLPSPSLVPKDDESDLSIQPTAPQVPFAISHTLQEVALYRYIGGIWSALCTTGTPLNNSPAVGVVQLNGVWLKGNSKADPASALTQLKVFPWMLLPGVARVASWSSTSTPATLSTSFAYEGLKISLSAGVPAAKIGTPPVSGAVAGLVVQLSGSATSPTVTIQFPEPVVLTLVSGLTYSVGSELPQILAPVCSVNGVALTPQNSSQDSTTQIYTQTFAPTGPVVEQITIAVSAQGLALYEIAYTTPPVEAAILPTAPALYALKVVTEIGAARVGSGQSAAAVSGSPVVEFVYFQTESGPGTAVGPAAPATLPDPEGTISYPTLAANCFNSGKQVNPGQQPASSFPLGGSVTDLGTYTQWSWPPDGDTFAYYGYDLNFEFIETYVPQLYACFAAKADQRFGLHLRCEDRNGLLTLTLISAAHVPSIPPMSALVGTAYVPKLPAAIAPPPKPPVFPIPIRLPLTPIELGALQLKAQGGTAAPTQSMLPSGPIKIIPGNPNLTAINGLTSVNAGLILHEIEELDAIGWVKANWFQPLKPSMRYTLDVVAGGDVSINGATFSVGGLGPILNGTDPIAIETAMKAYVTGENALTSLQRAQFTTSRYANFAAQMANVPAQLAGTSPTPLRHYVATTAPLTYLNNNQTTVQTATNAGQKYAADQTALVQDVGAFVPISDDLSATGAAGTNGAENLMAARSLAAADWAAYSQQVSALFDGVIAAMGRPDLASGNKRVLVPDTEISLFTDPTKLWVQAILLQSPEPIPWQRIWQWITLTAGEPADPLMPLWNADGTQGLLVPLQALRGPFGLSATFQGNIGAVAPCITWLGSAVIGTVALGTIEMGPLRIIRPGLKIPAPGAEGDDSPTLPPIATTLQGFAKAAGLGRSAS